MIEFILWGFTAFFGLIGVFGLLIDLKARTKDTILEWPFKIIFLVPYLLADWIFNWVYLSIWFRGDFPDSTFELATGRLKRYKLMPKNSREYKFADKWCARLNKHDPGHC